MTAQTLTTNLNADNLGFSFIGVASASATGMRSQIGNVTWTASTLTLATGSWTGLAYGDGYAVALNSNATTNITLDNGATAWLSYGAIPSGTAWGQLAYGNGYFVSVNSASTTAARMSIINQVQWTTTTLPSSTTWALCTFGNNNFVAVASSGTAAAYSSDNGATWTAVTLPVTGTWVDIEFFNGKFILIGSGQTNILTSTNGITWTNQTAALPSAATWVSLAYITGGTNGTWVAVCSAAATCAYSTDNGATWGTSALPSSANWKAIGGGLSAFRGRQMFVAAPQSATTGAFSYDGITWYTFTCTSNTWNKVVWCNTAWKSSVDTLTISDGATLTVNTNQQRAWNAITIANGKLSITNSSTTTPVVFATGRANATAALQSITPSSGLGSVEAIGDWIQIGTSAGTANQTFTSPYSRGEYVPTVWVETAAGSAVYEPWVNVTGYQSYQQYSPMRNGIRGVGNADGGTCFTQTADATKVAYINLTGVSLVANSHVVKCASTTGVYPGYKILITGVGVTMDATAVVESVIDSTTFISSVVATGTAGTKYTGLVGVLVPSLYNQYGTTLTFGDDIHGKIPPTGAKIRIPNIMLTDYTSAAYRNTGWSATDIPCYFVGASAGRFNYTNCLFGESYANYSQAANVTCTNVGFSYVPYVTECYALSYSNVGFAAPPVVTYLTVATALGATGSCTISSATLTIPSSTAIRPGVLITGTGIQPSVVSTVVSGTSLTLSQTAHTTSASIAYTYYGNWTERDYRAVQSTTVASLSSFTSVQYSYVSNAIFDTCVFAWGGHIYNAATTAAPAQSSACIGTTFSNNVTINNCKVIRLGISQRNRIQESALLSVSAGDTISVTGLKAYNTNIGTFGNTSNITITSPRSKHGIFNEGQNWVAGHKSYMDPNTGAALLPNTKYWYKSRAYYAHNLDDTSAYVDSFATCAAYNGVVENNHAPRIFGATPMASMFAAPSVAYGNSVWVTLFPGICASAVSADNGATWRMGTMPTTTLPYWKVIFVGGTTNLFFAFTGAQTGTVASVVVAASSDGIHWAQHIVSPSLSWLRGMAYDAGITTSKYVLIGGTTTTASGTVSSYSSNGFSWTAGGALPAATAWNACAASGAGRIVAIGGGGAVSTASAFTTTGQTWTAGGALASSLWQDIAFGSAKYVAISASAVNGPTAYSADAVAWTASTAPSLPSGTWQKIIWTGTVFVILSGVVESAYATAAAANFNGYYATSTDGITWSALKYLPENTAWIGMSNNGNAVLVTSTTTGRVAFTTDISVATPVWTTYKTTFGGAYINLVWDQMQPGFTTAPTALAAVATTAGSNVVTCTSTARTEIGSILQASPFASTVGTMPGTFGCNPGVRVTGITNATTFTVDANALVTATALTPSCFRHVWQLFRSTTSGFTPAAATLISSSNTIARVSMQDADVTPGTVYYYKLRKANKDLTLTCSGSAGTNIVTTAADFTRAITTTVVEGTTGTNVLRFTVVPGTSDAWALGVRVGMPVSGTTGVPAGTTVTAITEYDTVILSANLTTNIRQVADTVYFGLVAGMQVFGCPHGAEATITSVDSATQITLNATHPVAFTSLTVQFYDYWDSPEVAAIAQVPQVVQNNLLQSNTLATAPWANVSCTVTAAQSVMPTSILFGAAQTLTSCSVLVTAANATNTQSVILGVGTYTFSIYARATQPQINSTGLNTLILTLGTATNTVNLTNNWTRYSVQFTVATAGATTVSLTWPKNGTLGFVGMGMLTLGTDIPVPIAASTTVPVFQQTQTNPSGNGIMGWNFEENGSGVELNYTAATGTMWSHIHLGSTSAFTPSDANQIYTTEATGTDGLIYTTTASVNIMVSDYQQTAIASPCHAYPLFTLNGSNNITIKDSSFYFNGSLGLPINDTPAYNVYFHNIDFYNMRSYLGAIYADVSTAYNSSNGLKLQNCRGNKSRIPWAGQILGSKFKGVFGARNGRNNSVTAYNMNTSPTFDGLPISSTAVYDSMFHEMTFGSTGKGCLHLMMVGSQLVSKPYTLSGGAYFDNSGKLYLQAAGDSAIIEWPWKIIGVTSFDNIIPVVYAVDLCSASNVTYGVVALVEYMLDTGSGYSGTWKRLTLRPDLISSETGINAATGFNIKFRITARTGVKYTGRSTAFVVGETLQNAASSPTATMVVQEALEEGSGIGTLIVSNVTGTWGISNTIFSGATTRSTIVATNNDVFMPAATSYIAGLRVYTNVNTSYNYAYNNPVLTLTGLQSGSDVFILSAGTTTLLSQTDSNSGTTYSYTSNGSVTIDIGIIKQGYVPLYIRNYSLSSSASIPVAQVVDRNYA